jgi:aspartate racemase
MKTIGLIGGTSWVSTVDYYKLINQLTNEQLGGSNAARIILYSLNFGEIKKLLDVENWDSITAIYTEVAAKLKVAGAECVVFAANTPHLIADQVQKAVQLPLIHIAEETAKEIKKQHIQKVALLGTKFVMEKPFYQDKLSSYGVSTILPQKADREFIHQSIFTELTKGIFTEETKLRYLQIIDRLIEEGAEGVIYACTEIPILLHEQEVKVKTFDTTLIHAKAAVDFANSVNL